MDITSACAIKPAVPTRPKTVTVNGVAISREAIAQETQNHPAANSAEAWVSAARALVIRELLLQEARAIGAKPEPLTDADGRRETDDEALVRAVVAHAVHTPKPDEPACRRYYDQNQRRFRSADLCEVSHILIAAAPHDSAAREFGRMKAQAIAARLASDPQMFSALAREHSACPSREVGGNLGQIGPGQTVPEFERALAAIAPGTVGGDLVESRYGFHIVRVNRREAGQQLPFEMVQSKIAAYLTEHVERTAIRQYIAMLAGRATITGVEIAGSQSPLVQ